MCQSLTSCCAYTLIYDDRFDAVVLVGLRLRNDMRRWRGSTTFAVWRPTATDLILENGNNASFLRTNAFCGNNCVGNVRRVNPAMMLANHA